MGYYTGDPGFFSIFKTIGSAVAGMVPGVGGLLSKGISAIPTPVKRVGMAAGTAIMKRPVLSAAGAAGAIGLGAEGVRLARGKKATMTVTPGGIRIHHHKRMNVTNVKALRRSLRRAHGFAKLAMRVIHITHPKKKAHFGGFKKRRKAK